MLFSRDRKVSQSSPKGVDPLEEKMRLTICDRMAPSNRKKRARPLFIHPETVMGFTILQKGSIWLFISFYTIPTENFYWDRYNEQMLSVQMTWKCSGVTGEPFQKTRQIVEVHIHLWRDRKVSQSCLSSGSASERKMRLVISHLFPL